MEPQAPQMPQMAQGMDAVKAALARRAQGAPSPAVAQQMPPTGSTPTGGPNTPGTPPPAMPDTLPAPQQNVAGQPGAQDPTQEIANKSLKQLVNLVGSQTDPETNQLSKQLIVNLLKYH